jgi:adenosylcobinamide kinase / adenosylcobinamide-phosphate guanylyltransferase
MLTLVLGGARSGKSRFAQELALGWSPRPVYIATAKVWDDDFAARVRRHQADRGPEWTSFEEQKAISGLDVGGRVAVVDCATLWLTNFFLDEAQDVERSLGAARAELERFLALGSNAIFVSNELGLAPHAATEMGRKFVDLQGFFNQELARRAQTVVFMVAGIPMVVKGELRR